MLVALLLLSLCSLLYCEGFEPCEGDNCRVFAHRKPLLPTSTASKEDAIKRKKRKKTMLPDSALGVVFVSGSQNKKEQGATVLDDLTPSGNKGEKQKDIASASANSKGDKP